MNSMHLSDDEQVRVQGAPSYSVRAEIIDDQGRRHVGFLAVPPSALAQLDINRPESWPPGTRAVADGSLFSLMMPGLVRVWKRIGVDPGQRPSPQQGGGSAPGQRWVNGRWERGANGKMVWVAGHYEQQQSRPAPPAGPHARGGGRPAPPPNARPAPPPNTRPAPSPNTRPGTPSPRAAPSQRPAPRADGAMTPHARRGPPSPHRDFDRSYSADPDASWGSHVHAVYDDGSIALHDGRTFGAEEVEHYYGDGVIILRDGQQLSPPEGAQPVHAGPVTTWAAPVGVPGPEAAVHNGVTFAGLPPGTIFFDEDHSFGYQTAQGEVVTGYWNPDGTSRIDDPAIEDVRKAAAEGAAQGVADALSAIDTTSAASEEDNLLSLLE